MNHIKDLRLALGMTQEALASAVGVRKMSISRWESGQDIPRADRAIRLAEVLKCSVEELALEYPGVCNSA